MATYEITPAGFDGCGDGTDDRVLWVEADDRDQLTAAIEGTGALFFDTLDGDTDIDYHLPDDAEKLRKVLESYRDQSAEEG